MFVVLDTNHYDELANDSVFGRRVYCPVTSTILKRASFRIIRP